jgi:hypothetical protein
VNIAPVRTLTPSIDAVTVPPLSVSA